jgi:arginase family enzyme
MKQKRKEDMSGLRSRVTDYFCHSTIFGVAIDASDDPWALELKRASINASDCAERRLPDDLYDSLIPELRKLDPKIEALGKFSVPSLLTPRPRPSDAPFITQENMDAFVSDGGLQRLSWQLTDFVRKNVLPAMPIMLGVDHSATGGVVTALAEKLGSENLTVLVLDQHFDALPIAVRLPSDSGFGFNLGFLNTLSNLTNEAYCCGNFWKYLIDDAVVLPRNLLFVGVADYPEDGTSAGSERYRNAYLDFEARGCGFFPLKEFEGTYINRLRNFLREKITTPYLYVSLDLDVGSYQCVHAARYMDRPGLERKALMDIARIIRDESKSGKFQLAGSDVMEFNVHFSRIETSDGTKDHTVGLALDFLKELLFAEA